jgi:hypothetical protein
MAHIQKRDGRWKARYRGPDGRERSKMFDRRADAKRWLAAVQSQIARGAWVDPARSAVRLEVWVKDWLPSRADLRPSSRARLESIVRMHVIPEFGKRPLATIGNGEIRAWVGRMTTAGMSAAAIRKCVSALRSMLDAAVADQRLAVNPAVNVPLPTEHAAEQRYLDREQVLTLGDLITPRYRALVLAWRVRRAPLGRARGAAAREGGWAALPGDGIRDCHRHRRVYLFRAAEDTEICAYGAAGPQHYGRGGAASGRVCGARAGGAGLHLRDRRAAIPGHVLAVGMEAGGQEGGPGGAAHPRFEAQLRGDHDCRRGEPERGEHLGRALVGVVHLGPVRPPLRRARRRRRRPARPAASPGQTVR